MTKYFCDYCKGKLKGTKYVIMVNNLDGAIDIKADEKNICTINTTGKRFCCPMCLVDYIAVCVLSGVLLFSHTQQTAIINP